MTITVCALNDVKKTLESGPFTHVISIGSPNDFLPDFDPALKVLRKTFLDTPNPKNWDAPIPQDLRDIYHFVKSLPADTNILIHCVQGVSRSTAVAIIVNLIWLGIKKGNERKAGFDIFERYPHPVLHRFHLLHRTKPVFDAPTKVVG